MSNNIENQNIPHKFRNRPPKFIHSESELNNFIKLTILEWSENEFTCPYAIQTFISQIIEPAQMKAYFAQCYNNIHAMKEHIQFIQSINSHIWALFSCRPAVSFYDVYKLLEALCTPTNRSTIGPLTKIPVVKAVIFNHIDVRTRTPEIRLSDLILDCAEFINERCNAAPSSCMNTGNRTSTDRWNLISSQKSTELTVNSLSEKQFLHYLKVKYSVNDYNLLGVKITNFKALKEAAYAAKGESFHLLVSSDKLMRLLRPDLKQAMKNVREKLLQTDLFKLSNKSAESVTQFANLSVQESVKQAFDIIINEQLRVASKHGLPADVVDEKCLADARNAAQFLCENELHGGIFQLAAVGAALGQSECSQLQAAYNSSNNNCGPHHDTFEQLINVPIDQWRARIFVPLMEDINRFLHLSLSIGSQFPPSVLTDTHCRIITKSKAISHLWSTDSITTDSAPEFHQSKFTLLNNLANCATRIVERFSDETCLSNGGQLAQLQLDLLPQAYIILISLMSRCQLLKRPPTLPHGLRSVARNTNLIQSVFKAKSIDLILANRIKACKFTFEMVTELERQMLELLDVPSWPLDGSFIDYFNSNREEVERTIDILNVPHENGTDNGGNSNDAANQSISIRTDFITQLIRMAPKQVSMESFVSHTLAGCHGVALTNDMSKKSISAIWNCQSIRQSHLMEDGLAPVIDLRMSSSGSIVADPLGIQSDAALVMQAISRVELMQDAACHMRWDAIHHAFWGHIGPFVNDHAELAAALNVRLLLSAVGAIRICAKCCSLDLLDQYVTAMITIDPPEHNITDQSTNQFMGNITSLFITDLHSSLPICHLINRLAGLIDSASDFMRFSLAVIDATPPELLAAIVTHLLFPLSNRVCEPVDVSRTMQSVFTLCRRSNTVTALVRAQLCQASNHPVLDIIRCAEASRDRANINHSINSNIDNNINSKINIDIDHNINNNIDNQGSISTANEPIQPITSSANEMSLSDECEEEPNLVIVTSQTNHDQNEQQHRQTIVDDIRRNEFGIGLVTNDNITNQVMENFNAKMARLVEHLSHDLYANASHFILELIQNADDNSYNAHTRPRLDLMWRIEAAGALVLDVINNEKGFMESDLRALCDIGCSTKSKYRNSKIGRKGIGFKSVFLVSDRPEVHSNGFHVRFERYRVNDANVRVSNNALVPSWCDSVPLVPPGTPGMPLATLIRLPIIPSLTNHIQLSVAHQIKPHLLLFLRNLTRISMTSPSSSGSGQPQQQQQQRYIELVREECTSNYRVIQCENGVKHCWFLCTQQIPILEPEMIRISPRGLSVTELSIAIPLSDQQQQQEEEDCPTFAFLPIRSYGFRFIINADFSIPASREDIANECPWNRWLIEQAALVFAGCVTEFIGQDHADHVQNTIRIIKCIPLPGQVPTDSSFHALIPRIRSQLVQLCWLPDRNGKLHSPGQLIVESLDDVSLTSALCNRLNVTLLHPVIANCSDERVSRALDWLGCQALSLEHLGRLLNALKPADIADRCLMRSIIVAIHNGIERDHSIAASNRLLAQLSSMAIWPVIGRPTSTANTKLVSISQSELPIFLPPSHWPVVNNQDPYSSLRLMICPAFIASFKSPANNKHVNAAASILQRLGVHELNSSNMIDYAIIPQLANEKPARKWLIAASQFLVEHCQASQYRERVIPFLSFATVTFGCNGQSQLTVTPSSALYTVHLPDQLVTMTTVLPLLHNRIEYTVLDDAYLDCAIQPAHWRQFLCSAAETFYSGPPNQSERPHESHAQAQHEFPEMATLLNITDKRINVDLLRYLDINWNHLAAPKYNGLIEHFLLRPSIPVCASYDALNQSDQLLDLSLPLRLPSEALFLSASHPNKALLPNSLLVHFPICPVMFASNCLPIRLGMIDEVNANHILALMRRIFIEKSLSFTGNQSIDFYNWIKQNLSNISLINLISEFRSILGGATLVAVPTSNSSSTDDNREECELLIAQCCYWTLPIAEFSTKHIYIQDQQVAEDLKQLLSTHWVYRNQGDSCPLVKVFPGLKELFVDIMGIREFPSVSEVWGTLKGLLGLLSSERLKELNNAEVELIADVYNLVRFLEQQGDNAGENTNGQHSREAHGPHHRATVAELPLLPCLSGNYRPFIDTKRHVMIYSWRSYETVHAFQQHLQETDLAGPNCPIDFLSLCLSKRDKMNHYQHTNSTTRWTAAQFVIHYFQPPVLEDEMRFHVDNREAFEDCCYVKLMLHHLETIVHEWFQRNMPKEATVLCMNKLSSLTSFRSSSDDVAISVSLRNHPSIRYQYSDKIYIGAIDAGAHCHELLLGGIDLHLERLVAMGTVMEALITWILDGDRYNHFRERFKKFYRNLFDLIETSDDNQVSIFIRSHNLRINPCSIDYIFAAVRSVKAEEGEHEQQQQEQDQYWQQQQGGLEQESIHLIDSPAVSQSNPSSPVDITTNSSINSSNCQSAIVTIATAESNRRNLKRKRISISIENVTPAKQICSSLDDSSEQQKEADTTDADQSHQIDNNNHDNQSDETANGIATTQTNENRKLKVRIANPNSEPITINSDIDTATPEQISPLSMRLKEQMDSQKDVRLSMIGLTQDNMAQMSGRIGEQLAYQKLTANQRLGEWEIIRVDWLNQHKESRLPYDFKISARRADSSVADKIYLEVKATTQQSKLQFDLSPQEVTAAWSFKEHYHLLLVFHSGSYPDTNTRFIHIPDTLGQLQDNQCKLLLDVSQLLQK